MRIYSAYPQSGSSSTVFQVELEFRNVDFCGGRKIGDPSKKNPHSRDEDQQTQLNMASTLQGFEPGPHW